MNNSPVFAEPKLTRAERRNILVRALLAAIGTVIVVAISIIQMVSLPVPPVWLQYVLMGGFFTVGLGFVVFQFSRKTRFVHTKAGTAAFVFSGVAIMSMVALAVVTGIVDFGLPPLASALPCLEVQKLDIIQM